ncbi:MAG TPA: response regulator, partial [Gemmatimonadales bacterium]|nr:response regulator [Gemmatimonadales bacterium]
GGAIDLVLTDVMMPFSGVALGQEIRARWPEQRVLYMSAYPAESLQAEGLRRVDGPFLAKPFTAEELLSAVWAALEEPPRDAAAGRSASGVPAGGAVEREAGTAPAPQIGRPEE